MELETIPTVHSVQRQRPQDIEVVPARGSVVEGGAPSVTPPSNVQGSEDWLTTAVFIMIIMLCLVAALTPAGYVLFKKLRRIDGKWVFGNDPGIGREREVSIDGPRPTKARKMKVEG